MLALAVVLLGQVPAPASASPRAVAVLATSKRPAVDAYVAVLTGRARLLLQREGVGPLLDEAAALEQLKLAGITDPRSCQGGRACVARLATILGARVVVVGIDVGRAGASLAVIMEAVAADTGAPLHTSEFEVPIATYSDASALPVTLFARELKAKLDAEKPKTPEVVVTAKTAPDAPLAPKLEPAPLIPPTVAAGTPLSGRRAVGFTFAGGALIGGVVGVALAVVGNGAKGQINNSLIVGRTPPASTLTQGQLNSLAGQANGAFTGALISAIAAGVFVLVASYFLVSAS